MTEAEERRIIPLKPQKLDTFIDTATKAFIAAMPDAEQKTWGQLWFLNWLVDRLANQRLKSALYILLIASPIIFALGWSLAFQFFVVLPQLAGAG